MLLTFGNTTVDKTDVTMQVDYTPVYIGSIIGTVTAIFLVNLAVVKYVNRNMLKERTKKVELRKLDIAYMDEYAKRLEQSRQHAAEPFSQVTSTLVGITYTGLFLPVMKSLTRGFFKH